MALTNCGIVEYFGKLGVWIFSPQLPNVEKRLPIDVRDEFEERKVLERPLADERWTLGHETLPVKLGHL
jgi:hypothetical protein